MLAPYQLVKDLRSKLAIGDPARVLDGDLDALMHAFLVWRKTGKIAGDDKDESPELRPPHERKSSARRS